MPLLLANLDAPCLDIIYFTVADNLERPNRRHTFTVPEGKQNALRKRLLELI